jgi:hypothetical protein
MASINSSQFVYSLSQMPLPIMSYVATLITKSTGYSAVPTSVSSPPSAPSRKQRSSEAPCKALDNTPMTEALLVPGSSHQRCPFPHADAATRLFGTPGAATYFMEGPQDKKAKR